MLAGCVADEGERGAPEAQQAPKTGAETGEPRRSAKHAAVAPRRP